MEVREGTYAEAWLAGWLSNLTHGLRYTPVEKRSAVEAALQIYREDSNRMLADRLRVSHVLVGDVRKELAPTHFSSS